MRWQSIEFNSVFSIRLNTMTCFSLFLQVSQLGIVQGPYYSLHPHQGVTQWASNYCTSITFSRKISLQSSKKQHTQNPFCPPKTKQKQCYNSVLNGRRRALPTFSKQIRAVEKTQYTELWLTGKIEKLPNSLYFIYYVNNL